MSRFVEILNIIRQNVNPDWLTPSQRSAYSLVNERLGFLDEVNFWGRPGTGKTFLGWVLHAERLAVYNPRLAEIKPPSSVSTAIVDNSGWQRSVVRDLLHECRNLGYRKIVLVTREPVQEQISTIEVKLTDEDLAVASTNLSSIGILSYSAAPRNLWDLVSPIELT